MPIESKLQEEKKQNILAWQDMPGKESLKQKLAQHPVDQCALNLWLGGIDDTDVKLISQYLATHPKITHLNLDNNNIGVEGAKALAQNVTLTSLTCGYVYDLGNNTLSFVKDAIAQNKAFYLSFISKIDDIKSWSAGLLEYLTIYANMKSSSFFSDKEQNIYTADHKSKIDKVANDLVTQGYLCKTEEDLYDIVIFNKDSLQCMPSSLHNLMNSYIELDHDLTREYVTHALGEVNGQRYECCLNI